MLGEKSKQFAVFLCGLPEVPHNLRPDCHLGRNNNFQIVLKRFFKKEAP